MKRRHIIGLGIIVAFISFSIVVFSNSLTPYVSIAQAKTTKSTVQVRGVLGADKVTVADNGKSVQFILRDEAGDEVKVVYSGTKPDGLEQASSLVAVGKYQNDQFLAEKLLIKCPSKYQGSVNKP